MALFQPWALGKFSDADPSAPYEVASWHEVDHKHDWKDNFSDGTFVNPWSIQDSGADIFDSSKHIFNLLGANKLPQVLLFALAGYQTG